MSLLPLRRRPAGAGLGRAEEAGAPRLSTRWWEMAGYGSLLLAAALMRLWDLGSRAMHHDESLHAYYSWGLSKGNGFTHNPLMHGPLQFEANAGVFWLFGDTEFTARVLYAVAGVVVVGLPFLLRSRLGRLGALLVAVLLAFSPAMLYFSRFARNDILMAAWTLGLLVTMWRYLDEGKNRYLYIAAVLLALAFSSKETAYIVTLIFGLFLFLLVIPFGWVQAQRDAGVARASPPVVILRFAAAGWSALGRGLRLSGASRPASFFILMVTLTLPLWSAFVGFFQDTPLLSWTNLVLAAPVTVPQVLPIGAPSGGGLVIAAVVVFITLGLSVYWGARWNWSVWWRCALIFHGVWILLFTTFFTNVTGIGSGVWQSMGYWVVQQGEARGGQPWYYYFVITSIYEFLPLIIGLIAAVYYLRKKDVFGHFLVFWSVATFIVYTMASEKMPWLLLSTTLPLIVMSGRFLADVLQGIQWGRLVRRGGILLLAAVPLFLLTLWRLAFLEPEGWGSADVLVVVGLAAALLLMAVHWLWAARGSGLGNAAAVSLVSLAAVLLVLTVRTGALASYQNGDTPVEMIVYTQTTPDLVRVYEEIAQTGDATGQEFDVPVTIDATSGFTWPWVWYLRKYTRASYPNLEDTQSPPVAGTAVVVVHSANQVGTEPLLTESYTEGQRLKHRWWFPESTYRDLTLGKFIQGFGDRTTWRRAMDYFLYRQGVEEQIGSEDSFVYFDRGLQRGSDASQ